MRRCTNGTSYILTWNHVSLLGGYRDQEEAYLQEVHLQRCGPGPASGHVLVSEVEQLMLHGDQLTRLYYVFVVWPAN